MAENRPSSRRQSLSRQELVELVRSQLEALLQQDNLQGAKALLVPVQPVNIAQAIEDLPKAMQFLFGSLGLDPALMSAPFITTAVDVLGVFVYLMIARVILQI